MGRPRKPGLDYWSHDCNLRDSFEIKCMRRMFGNDGYVFYVVLLEIVYAEKDCILVVTPKKYDYLVEEVGVKRKKFDEMLEAATSVELHLFDAEAWKTERILTSSSIQERAKLALHKRETARTKTDGVSAPETRQKLARNSPDWCDSGAESTVPNRTLPEITVPKTTVPKKAAAAALSLAAKWLGRELTPLEVETIREWPEDEETVIKAIEEAGMCGGKSLAYVAAILERQARPPPSKFDPNAGKYQGVAQH